MPQMSQQVTSAWRVPSREGDGGAACRGRARRARRWQMTYPADRTGEIQGSGPGAGRAAASRKVTEQRQNAADVRMSAVAARPQGPGAGAYRAASLLARCAAWFTGPPSRAPGGD